MIKTDLGSECARPIAKCDNVINTYCRTSNSCPFCPNNERCIVGLVCQGSQKTCVATAHNSQFCVRRKNGFFLNFFLYLMNWLRNKYGVKLPARPQSWSDVIAHLKIIHLFNFRFIEIFINLTYFQLKAQKCVIILKKTLNSLLLILKNKSYGN